MALKYRFESDIIPYLGASATFNQKNTNVSVFVDPYAQYFSLPLSPNQIIFSGDTTGSTLNLGNLVISTVNQTTNISVGYGFCYSGLSTDGWIRWKEAIYDIYVDNVLVDNSIIDMSTFINRMELCGTDTYVYGNLTGNFNNLFGDEMLIVQKQVIEIYGPTTAKFAPEASGKTYTCDSAPTYTFTSNSDVLANMNDIKGSIITTIAPNGFFFLSKDGQVRKYQRKASSDEAVGYGGPAEICPTPTPTASSTPTPIPSPTPTPTPTATPIPIPQIITTGLTSYLNYSPSSYFGTGTTWTNVGLSGSTYNATLVASPTFTSGSPGFFDFDGTTQYATLAQAASGSTTGSYTLSAWVQVPTGATSELYITRGELAAPPSNYSLRLGKSSSNTFTAEAYTSSGFGIAGTTTINSSTWYNITLRWISGTGLSLWVNGVKEAETLTSTTSLRTSTSVGWILMKNETTNYAPGKLSSVAMYFRNLSDAEILSNFNTLKSIYGY